METQEQNLALWLSVEKTDPKHTKQANVRGNKITAIAPQYQMFNATRVFGRYGESWGFKSLKHDYSLVEKFNLIILDAVFFFPTGEFPISSSMKLYMNKDNTIVDADFAKKLETDTLTKALSKLGFNADVFMGKYDDVKYLQQVKQEFTELIDLTSQAAMENAKRGVSIEQMRTLYKMTKDQETKYNTLLNQ